MRPQGQEQNDMAGFRIAIKLYKSLTEGEQNESKRHDKSTEGI